MPDPKVDAISGAVTAEAATLLDNPIWHALGTAHASIALSNGLAHRYPPPIGPLSGIPSQDEENYAALDALAPRELAVLFSIEPFRIPAIWQVLRASQLVQMVRPVPGEGTDAPAIDFGTGDVRMRPLTAADAPAMLALADLTEPGPFRLRTLELGGFHGMFENGRLVSMAGRRLHLPGLVEVSAVCTHPEARGRGYARRLMQQVIAGIEREGNTAFLHSLPDNPAIRLYEQLGFRPRRSFRWVVLKPAP